uniref:N-acylamino acid racemase n=1 Tax=Deinococcus radiodurans TaxID=1299 RepID=UPI00005DB3D0|nr:Chain A, N-acylamino acid racemase [Deinococcus radiodurans]2GGI_B Chain B, N-acylamino acid racemase [Deinococcus radiodurans]2GGI_C Chain C, N-acylamino acid racemase [Deinococcus radiodurans]2GGI_D Chain D, N-acylamino acid racemase [Deinococcus radiodurans]
MAHTGRMFKIEAAEIVVARLPLKFRFETSFGVQTHKVVPLLILHGEGVQGVAEGTMEARPMYREETIAGALDLLRGTFLPAILGQTFANPEAVSDALGSYRGNRMARAMVEMAAWDLWARTLGVPLGTLLGGHKEQVEVGVSLGIQADCQATVDLVRRHVEQGYRRIKLKIKPGWDVQPVRCTREAFPDIRLTVDANSAYTLADAGRLRQLDEYDLTYIEQPLAWDDLVDHAELARRIRTPLCLDESVASASDARKALALGAGGVINLKVARVGGHAESRRVHDVAQSFGAPVWCGGMLESGIGRAHNIHLSTLSNFRLPGDTSSASRYWERDLIQEPLEAVDGLMPVPQGPGTGVTLDREFLATVTEAQEEHRA